MNILNQAILSASFLSGLALCAAGVGAYVGSLAGALSNIDPVPH